MPTRQPLIPGVYRPDIFPTPAPVLPTGVPVFLGWTAKGIAYQPRRLTLWTQFVEQFGHCPRGYLAGAVHGFFSNGGQICYVVPLPNLSESLPLFPARVDDREVAIEDALQTALATTDSLEEIDLVCLPDLFLHAWSDERIQRMQSLALKHCDDKGDRFAILDTPRETTLDRLQQKKLSGNNGALYAPWVKPEYVPPLVTEPNNYWVPPCGHVAGSYARSDRRGGVHLAPANLVLEDVLDLKYDFSATEQAVLSAPEVGINYLRVFPGRGIRVWGARTLSGDPDWRYINVRRLVLTVRRWVERDLSGVAFEPNDFRLWVRIERELTGYLETLALQGAFRGTTPQEAFYVKCDAETNPPEVRDAGQVITEIGLAPTLPNEFIIIRLIHGDTGVTLSR